MWVQVLSALEQQQVGLAERAWHWRELLERAINGSPASSQISAAGLALYDDMEGPFASIPTGYQVGKPGLAPSSRGEDVLPPSSTSLPRNGCRPHLKTELHAALPSPKALSGSQGPSPQRIGLPVGRSPEPRPPYETACLLGPA
jgi:hypothetical protein